MYELVIIMQSLNIKEWKLLELQITQTRNPLSILRSSSRPQNEKKKSWNVYKIWGAHLQCVNNYYAKFEYKRKKTVGVTGYTIPTPTTHFGWKNV